MKNKKISKILMFYL